MTLDQLAGSLARLSASVAALAAAHPDWTVERNAVRNYMVLSADETYAGYIDLGQDAVQLDEPPGGHP